VGEKVGEGLASRNKGRVQPETVTDHPNMLDGAIAMIVK
jgi:hypothetical protein